MINPQAIRWIDKNIGTLLCFFLTIHRRICGIFKRNPNRNKKFSKILFIKLIEQGSTVLAYPALKKAQNYVGVKNVYIMVFKENRPILDILGIVASSNIIEVDSGSLRKLVYSVIKALIKLRKEKIDAVINMEFFSRASAIISYISGANKRAGFHIFTHEGPYQGDLFTHRLIYNPYLHTSLLFMSLVEALNHDPDSDSAPITFEVPKIIDNNPCFSPTEIEKKSLIKKLETLKQSSLNKPIIILNPNPDDVLPVRRWPEKNFIRLGRMLLEGFPQAAVVITGTSNGKEIADNIAFKIGGAISLAGQTSLRELLTLYCIGDILVTSDSGPAHFSTLAPIKSIILFGPETPVLYGASSKHVEIISPNLVCSPCVNAYNYRISPCKNAICLKSITVEDVYEKIKNTLEEKRIETCISL